MKYSLLPILIIVFAQCCFGQDTTGTKFRITTTPTQYLFLDFPVTIEKVYKRQTIGLTLGFRPATQRSGDAGSAGFGIFGNYLDQAFFNKLYNGVTIGINSKYYLSQNNSLFIEGNLFYRYWWFNNKSSQFGSVEPGYKFSGTRTESQNVFGLKVLFGNSYQVKTRSKIKPVADLYLGLGVRYKTYNFKTRSGVVDGTYYSYLNETGQVVNSAAGGIPFSFQMGIRVGIANYSSSR